MRYVPQFFILSGILMLDYKTLVNVLFPKLFKNLTPYSLDYKILVNLSSFKLSKISTPYSTVGHLHFFSWIIQTLRPRVFVELGTHSGNSYFAVCQTIKENKLKSFAYAVDNWRGDIHSGLYDDSIYHEVRNHNESYFADFSKLIKCDFDEAINFFPNNSIDMLHIDGLHSYEAVKHDFETWLPKLSSGAVVIFHDTSVMDRDFGVNKYFNELKEIYPLTMEFSHSYGLGILQINNYSSNLNGGSIVGNEMQLWLSPDFSQRTELINFFTELGRLFEASINSIENERKAAIYEAKIADYHNLVMHLRGEK